MCLSLRLALAVVLCLIVYPFAQGQDTKPGSQASGPIAQPANGRSLVPIDDKADRNKKDNKSVSDDAPDANGVSNVNPSIGDPLLRMLVTKGILTAAEGTAINAGGSPLEQRDRLAALLRDKGFISPAEFDAVRAVPPDAKRASASTAATEKPTPSELNSSTAGQPKA